MQREIKFKAWCGAKKHWADEVDVFDDGSYLIGFPNEEAAERTRLPQPEDKLVQFTGLRDSKGVKVFEGDILRLPNEHYKLFKSWEWEGKEDGIYKVFFDQKIASFLAEDQHLKTIYLWLPVNHGAEVIGNIYQNPELLDVKNEAKAE